LFQVALAASNPQPNAVGAGVGAVVAASGLLRRGVGWVVIITAAVVSGITAGVFWGILSAMHADRWATVLDAALCPLIAVGTAWVVERFKPASATSPELTVGNRPQ